MIDSVTPGTWRFGIDAKSICDGSSTHLVSVSISNFLIVMEMDVWTPGTIPNFGIYFLQRYNYCHYVAYIQLYGMWYGTDVCPYGGRWVYNVYLDKTVEIGRNSTRCWRYDELFSNLY